LITKKQATGRWGETEAARFLQGKGYTILDRNIRTPHGEIDILAARDGMLVFVEVRTRRSHSFGYPEASVTTRKQASMLAAVDEYLGDHPEAGDTWQVDVIAVEGTPGRLISIEHFENVLA
jgi:putative endonuclease